MTQDNESPVAAGALTRNRQSLFLKNFFDLKNSFLVEVCKADALRIFARQTFVKILNERIKKNLRSF
jgi:hypothetical protein